MIKFNLVKVKNSDDADYDASVNVPAGYMNHGTKVLRELVETWAVKGDRVVAAYSYFASVQSEKELEYTGLSFIGLVKQESRQYPMEHL